MTKSKTTRTVVGSTKVMPPVKGCNRCRRTITTTTTKTHGGSTASSRSVTRCCISSSMMMMMVLLLSLAIIMPQQRQHRQNCAFFVFVNGQQTAGRVMTGLGSKLQDLPHQKTKSSGGGGSGGGIGRKPKPNRVKQGEDESNSSTSSVGRNFPLKKALMSLFGRPGDRGDGGGQNNEGGGGTAAERFEWGDENIHATKMGVMLGVIVVAVSMLWTTTYQSHLSKYERSLESRKVRDDGSVIGYHDHEGQGPVLQFTSVHVKRLNEQNEQQHHLEQHHLEQHHLDGPSINSIEHHSTRLIRRSVGQWTPSTTFYSTYNHIQRRYKTDRPDESPWNFPPEIMVEGDHVVAMSGLESVDLGFSDLYLEMKQKKKRKKRTTRNEHEGSNGESRLLLDGSIRGRARPGRMLAIMGPSGAGKSTVLHALAGKIKASSKLRLEGRRYVNGEPITGDSQVPAAFVEQEVTFFPHMTVRETLAFRVELKLGSLISKHAQAERVEELIEELNLSKAADTIVGDAKVRGISGGERRRLAIACELIASPSLIFLDEPTSGLDSTAATSIVESMRKLADSGKTIIAVIHQPSQHVFDAFDDLLLLSDGKQMYFGSVDGVRDYMNSHVAKAPQGMGTAEHVLDCISKLKMPGETDEDMIKRIDRVTELAKKEDVAVGALTSSSSNTMERYTGDTHTRRANIFVQFKLLLRRSLNENFRGKAALIIKLVQQVSLGLIYGTIYSIDLSQASIQNRFGLLSLIAIGAANMAMASTVRSFPKEKAIVSSELAGNLYATLPYFVGKAISEIPLTVFLNSVFGFIVSALTGINGTWEKLRRFLGITSMNTLSGQAAGLMLGSIAPSQDAALAMFPAVMVLNIIFDGKNISQESTPWFLRWLPKVGLIRWGFEGLCLNEFEGLEFETKGPRRGPVAKNGVEALSRFGLGDNTVADVLKTQLLLISGSWFLSYLGLTLSRQKFQYMEEPKQDNDDSSDRKNGSTTSL